MASDTYNEILGVKKNRPAGMKVFNDEPLPGTVSDDEKAPPAPAAPPAPQSTPTPQSTGTGTNTGQTPSANSSTTNPTVNKIVQPAPAIDNSLQGLPEQGEQLNDSEQAKQEARTQNEPTDKIANPNATPAAHVEQTNDKVEQMVKDKAESLNRNSEIEKEKANANLGLDKDGNLVDESKLYDKDGKLDLEKLRNLAERKKTEAILDYLNQNKSETPEEKKKREKREKWGKIFSAIGDGVSSLANLYYASKGAPNMYDGKNSLSKASQERYEKLKAERDETRDRRLKAMEMLGELANNHIEDDQKHELQNLRILTQAQNMDLKAKEWEQKAELYKRKGDLTNAEIALSNARQAQAEAATLKTQLQTKYIPQQEEDKHQVQQATVRPKDAAANNSNASAREHNRRGTSAWVSPSKPSGGKSGKGSGGGSSSGSGVPWKDEDGNIHYAKTEAAAKQQAKLHHTYVDDYSTNTRSQYGIKTTTRTHNGWHSEAPKKPAAKPAAKPKPKAKPAPKKKGWASGLKL